MGDGLRFLVGLTALTLGADWLVRGSCNLADRYRLSPLLVGLTVVAFGTSAPELVVSAVGSIQGRPGLVVGNVMGSTVANVGLILGVGALLRPIAVHRTLLFRETPLLVLVLLIVIMLTLNGSVGRGDGIALVTGFFIYLTFVIRWGIKANSLPRITEPESKPHDESGAEATGAERQRPPEQVPGLVSNIFKVVVGTLGLFVGAQLLVDSAVQIARAFNVPEAVIGATLVAVGTSLPELASTVAAALRGLGDIALGNVIGSNVFNLGLALGMAAVLRPLELSTQLAVRQVLPAVIFCFLLIPLAFTRNKVARWEGTILLLGYAAFIAWNTA
jgi:cation:H+ antiporter